MMTTLQLTWSVIKFDLRFNLRKPTFWIYWVLFFLLAFLFMTSDVVQIGGGVGKVAHNAPIAIAQLQLIFSIVSSIMLSGIAGTAVIRDMEMKTHELFFTTGMTKFSYVVGRYIGSVIVMALILLAPPVGLWLGSIIAPIAGWLPADKIAPFSLAAYMNPFIYVVLPNVLFMSALFFACGLLFRNFIAVYVQGIALLSLQSIAGTFLRDLDNKIISALSDPFANRAFTLLTEYWTTAERNALPLPLEGYLLWNRLLWLSVGIGIFVLTYTMFRFSSQGIALRTRKTKQESDSVEQKVLTPKPRIQQSFEVETSWSQFFASIGFYFRDIVRSGPFIAITLIGMIQFGIAARQAGRIYDGTMYPVSYIMFDVINSFTLFMLIIMVYYSGELVWRERTLKLDQITDALPASRLAILLSKITALSLVSAVLYGFTIIGAIITQTLKGYTNYELHVYLVGVYGIDWVSMVQLIALSFMVQILVGNKYFGHFLVITLFIGQAFLSELGLEHPLWYYAQTRFGTYSDMNGYLPFWRAGVSYALFNSALALVLICIGYIVQQRGTEQSIMARLRLAYSHATSLALSALVGALVLACASGGWVWYNTNVLNVYRTQKEGEKLRVEYEKTYRAKYLNFPQPRIIATTIHVDLFPEEHRYVSWGTHTFVNKTDKPIDTLYLSYDNGLTLLKAEVNRPADMVYKDTVAGIRLLKLQTPLAPNDTAQLLFSFGLMGRSFSTPTGIVDNGTFLNNGDVACAFGYSEGGELRDPDKRKKYGLPERDDVPKLGDSISRMNTYISQDADRIDFEAFVSTSPDQIAIAPGYLQAEWKAAIPYRPDMGTRRYFHYKMDTPILNFYSFQSARYAVERDVWKDPAGKQADVNVEVYYHPAHAYNVKTMIEATKKGLDYFTKEFSPYQHRQFRIIEFPRYASFAQSFANTIPYSEDIGFLRRMTGEEDEINFTFFVTAHELAHQWWAHQVIGAAQEGSTMMSESLAEYSALMVMKHHYGDNMMRRFLKHELNDYLRGRGNERKAEQPLMRNRNQSYIHYNKGSHVLYALADHIGENRINQALAKYIKAVGFQSAPYTNAEEFVGFLKRETPDSLQFMLSDLVEKITLFDNRTTSAVSVKQADGTYAVTLSISAKKMYNDSLGNETPVGFGAGGASNAEYIDIGVFAKSEGSGTSLGKPLYLKKHRIDNQQMQITIVVPSEPAKAGIDPYNKLIDRVISDNVVSVQQK